MKSYATTVCCPATTRVGSQVDTIDGVGGRSQLIHACPQRLSCTLGESSQPEAGKIVAAYTATSPVLGSTNCRLMSSATLWIICDVTSWSAMPADCSEA